MQYAPCGHKPKLAITKQNLQATGDCKKKLYTSARMKLILQPPTISRILFPKQMPCIRAITIQRMRFRLQTTIHFPLPLVTPPAQRRPIHPIGILIPEFVNADFTAGEIFLAIVALFADVCHCAISHASRDQLGIAKCGLHLNSFNTESVRAPMHVP